MFRLYIDSENGLGTLHSLAEDGMRAWDCSRDQVNSLSDAFEDITFKALSIAALEHFAATAHEKVLMPELPKKSVPESVKPKPHDSAKPSAQSTEPRRPTARAPLHRLTP